MPTRILREGIITSPQVNKLSDKAELFYRRLMSVADDHGRYFAHPAVLRGACYPLKVNSVCESDVKQMLSECVAVGLIVLYGEGNYLQILKFKQQARTKSKFPEPTEPEVLIKCEAAANQMSSLVGGEGVVGGEGECAAARPHEIPTLEQAIAQTMTAGIPQDFCGWVYADWSSRNGKDGGGNVVPWLPYVTKRWAREQVEWRAGTHRGKKQQQGGASKPRDAVQEARHMLQ